MRTHPMIIVVALLGLTGCGQVSTEEEGQPTTTTPPTAATTAVPTTAAVPITAAQPSTTVRATTTTAPLSRAEATSRLCTTVGSADESIQRGSFVGGGLRLSSGISANEKAADAAVVSAARTMLRVGLDGDAQGYVTARQAASAACAKAGYPIVIRGPIMCIRAPCP